VETDLLISIVIPVKNGDYWLENLLQKLMRQTLFPQSEIIVIDSGSTDGSIDIINRYPVRLIQIQPGEFNHGDTRNLGVREARGKYVVMTVQDAVPATDQWLQHFVDGFSDGKAVGLCGQQVVPHELDKNPVLWFRPVSAPRNTFYRYDKPQDFLQLSISQQRELVGWDNVTSAYHRDILLQFPFPRIDFAEDIFWAREMLIKGYTLGHIDEARVFHYHHYPPRFVLPRYFSVYYFEHKAFGLSPEPVRSVIRKILSATRILLRESAVSWPAKGKWLIYNVRYWLALRKTIRIFNDALIKGDSFLDEQYRQICKKAPQALKY
jgi:rhamnosyltransferase